jgi:hypothetical protein
MNMPTLLSSNHEGNGRESMDAQSGVYCCSVNGKKEQQIAVKNTTVVREYILFICKKKEQP